MVRQYTSQHAKWVKFEKILAEQNLLEMRPLGQRNAPLCDGCLKLKEHAVEYVTDTMAVTEVKFTGYLETIFSGAASHYCKVNFTDDFITGFMYKKDKIHDHIPIPEPTRVSSFIQFPVPMPFHALTFTLTFVGICRKCDKLWYCDTLQSANWTNRMKWVIPTSARKWYSFGVTEGPGSGAHGIQFSTKGYKGFLVLSDTWGRQEQWMHAIDEAIMGLASQTSRRIDSASAMAIEIDNEVDADEFDMVRMRAAVESESHYDEKQHSAKMIEEQSRPRSKTVSAADCDSDSDLSDGSPKTTKVPSKRFTSPPISPTKDPSSPQRQRSSSNDKPLRALDLKKFQPDTKKFAEILTKLKMASPPRVNANPSAPLHNTRNTPKPQPLSMGLKKSSKQGLLSATISGIMQSPGAAPTGDMGPRTGSGLQHLDRMELEAIGLRHVVSTPDLTRLK